MPPIAQAAEIRIDVFFSTIDRYSFSVMVDVARLHQLKDLALGHRVRRGGDEFEDGHVAVVGHQMEGFGVEEIPDEDARRIAPDLVCGNLPPPGFRMVDHVVVKQGGGMDELDDRRQGVAALPPVAAEFRGGQEQEGPETLAAAADQVVDDLRDEPNLRTEVHLHVFLDPFEVVSEIVKYILYLHDLTPGCGNPGLKRSAISSTLMQAHITDAPRNVKQPIGMTQPLRRRAALFDMIRARPGMVPANICI